MIGHLVGVRHALLEAQCQESAANFLVANHVIMNWILKDQQ